MGWFDSLYSDVKENPDVWLRFASSFAPQQYRPGIRGAAGVTTMIKAPKRQEEWMTSRSKVTDYETAKKRGDKDLEGKQPSAQDYSRADKAAPPSSLDVGLSTATTLANDMEEMKKVEQYKQSELLRSAMAAHQPPKLYRPPAGNDSMASLVKLLSQLMKQGK